MIKMTHQIFQQTQNSCGVSASNQNQILLAPTTVICQQPSLYPSCTDLLELVKWWNSFSMSTVSLFCCWSNWTWS